MLWGLLPEQHYISRIFVRAATPGIIAAARRSVLCVTITEPGIKDAPGLGQSLIFKG